MSRVRTSSPAPFYVGVCYGSKTSDYPLCYNSTAVWLLCTFQAIQVRQVLKGRTVYIDTWLHYSPYLANSSQRLVHPSMWGRDDLLGLLVLVYGGNSLALANEVTSHNLVSRSIFISELCINIIRYKSCNYIKTASGAIPKLLNNLHLHWY